MTCCNRSDSTVGKNEVSADMFNHSPDSPAPAIDACSVITFTPPLPGANVFSTPINHRYLPSPGWLYGQWHPSPPPSLQMIFNGFHLVALENQTSGVSNQVFFFCSPLLNSWMCKMPYNALSWIGTFHSQDWTEAATWSTLGPVESRYSHIEEE